MPKLLIVYFDLGIGGVQRKIVDIVNYINHNKNYKNSSTQILLEERKKFTLESQISDPKTRVLYKPLYRMPFWGFIVLHILLFRPHVILAFLPKLSIYVTMLRKIIFWRKVRVILGEDVVPTHSYKLGEFDKKYLYKISQYYCHADRIITPSAYIKQDLVQHFKVPRGLISIIPNWATTRILNYKKDIDLIYAGRLDPEKAIPRLVKVVLNLKKLKSNISLQLIGEGKELKRLKKLITKNKLQRNITLLGPQENITGLLARAKIAVFASTKKEGMPFFLLEAMGASLPIVSMRYPGIDELLTDGQTGFICPSRLKLLLTIKKLLKNKYLRERIGRNAQQVVSRYYNYKRLKCYVDTLFNSTI